MFIHKRSIKAAEEIEEEVQDITVAPEATDLLFEAEDVAELLAEVTDQVVEVAVDGEDVVFNVGEDEFVVTPEGDEELVESSTKTIKSGCGAKKAKMPVKSSTQRKVIRKVRK